MNPPICDQCGRVYKPDPRTAHQKTCRRLRCRRARNRAKMRRWRTLHPKHTAAYRPKVRAWAKAYPDYWRQYRKNNRVYAERDNKRRRRAHREARRAANVTAIASIFRRKLQDLTSLRSPESAANVTLMDRRINGIVDYLVWRDRAANVTDIALMAASSE